MSKKEKNPIFWSLSDKLVRKGLSFIVSIFLARLLNPDDFGVLAMATLFFGWVELFTDFGLGQSIIQKKDGNDVQYSTIFWLNVMMGMLLYLLFYIASPFIADFFNTPILKPIIRVSALGFVVSGFGMVQSSLIIKELDYRRNFYISVSSTVVYGIVGIALAYYGLGVWSLVFCTMAGGITGAILFWVLSDWRPKFVLKFKETKEMFHSGFQFMSFGFINNLFDSLDVLLFSKIYNAQVLGLYNRAISLRDLPLGTFILPITRPLFPIFARIQSDIEEVRRTYFHYLHLIEFLGFVIGGLIFLSAEQIVVILYTDKWLVAGEYLKYAIWLVPLEPNKVIITSLLKGLGKLKLLIYLNFYERSIIVVALAVGYFFGIEWFLMSFIFLRMCTLIQRIYFVARIIGVTFMSQMAALAKSIAVLLGAILLVNFISIDNNYLSVVVKSIMFIGLYLTLARVFKLKGFSIAWRIAQEKVMPMFLRFYK